jgi:zinc D-Ala-D-Ala dipeptidase
MRSQIEKTLPRSAWEGIAIEENNEPLVEIKETKKLRFGLIQKQYQPLFWVRKSVAEKLMRVSESLPTDLKLVLIEGYRTLEHQKESWDTKFEKLKTENPELTVEEIERKVRLVVAKPNPLANHHCGGAVDVTLLYADGRLLDMGTPYPSEGVEIELYRKFPMLSSEITQEHRVNRKIMRDVMETEDFVWYPGEWWHFCYGDRMWAVYSNQKECVYGPIKLQ